MKPKSISLCIAIIAFIGATISCGKDSEEIPSVSNEKDTTMIVPPKKDTVYIIDTTIKIAINEILYLEDYSMAAVSGDWRGIAYGNGRWVVVGAAGKIATSTDGVFWSAKTVGSNNWNNIYYSGIYGRWMAVGDNGKSTTSTNGTDWSIEEIGSVSFNGVGDVRTSIVAVGNDGYVSNFNSGAWRGTTKIGANNLMGVCGGYRRGIVVGLGGFIGFLDYGDSSNELALVGSQIVGGSTDWNSVIHGSGPYTGGHLVAVGSGGKIAISTSDGDTWNIQQVGTTNWKDIVYRNGIWIAVGQNGQIAVSRDLIKVVDYTVQLGTWDIQHVGGNNWMGVAGKMD